MQHPERELQALARDLSRLAASTHERGISCRLAVMADEALGLADRESADSPIYHSAIFFRHTGRPANDVDPHADDHSTRPTQRN